MGFGDRRARLAALRTRSRRRVDVALLAIGLAIAGGAAAVGAAAGDDERVTALWAGAEVDDGGTARIVEVIDYDFGVERRHGIFRDVPDLPFDAPVVVQSATAPDEFVLIPQDAAVTRIRIGDPDRTISGRHRYTIEYVLPRLSGDGGTAWDALGTSWDVPVHDVEAHLVAPFRFDRLRCFRGESGSRRSCPV